MSIIWGVLQEQGASVSEFELRQLATRTQRYAAMQSVVYVCQRVGMGIQLTPSHERNGMENGPVSDIHGNVVCFDGRLDNVREIANLLDLNEGNASDSEIVLASFVRWGEACFSRLTGDWALALWARQSERLLLARDHAGTRSLYFQQRQDAILWSTYLDTFMAANLSDQLSEEYAANYLSGLPIRDRTPYKGIYGVRPGHYAVFGDHGSSQKGHWSPLIRSSIRYKDDREYDEHFLALFEASVACRTGAGAPILAQLSGGMDSTSIVCMSDYIRHTANPDAEILDTISYFDDSEASLNERPYFTITEARRGKTGIHFDTAFSQRSFDPPWADEGSYLWPGADSFSISQERLLLQLVWDKGYRAILSGIGGDEILGGVPIPQPELAGYLVSANVKKLLQQSLAWCMVDRSPLISSLCETARYTLRLYAKMPGQARKLPPWLSTELRGLVTYPDDKDLGMPTRVGVAPYQLDNALTWWSVMETLPHLQPQMLFRPEYRYPMLDKDLITFLFSIPREQLLKPGRRRALMRRALQHIVPNEILERRRKAFQFRAPLSAAQQAHKKLDRLWDESHLVKEGFINVDVLRAELRRCAGGAPEWTHALLKAVAYELWLRARRSEEPSASPLIECRSPQVSLAGS